MKGLATSLWRANISIPAKLAILKTTLRTRNAVKRLKARVRRTRPSRISSSNNSKPKQRRRKQPRTRLRMPYYKSPLRTKPGAATARMRLGLSTAPKKTTKQASTWRPGWL